jgi:phosphoribosyl 1,2-cyclic phosphodiesterase
VWFAVTAAINSGLVMWSAGHGGRIAWCAVVRSHLRLIGQAGGMLLAMRAYFCGTRGSTPVSGAEHLHYGGHTSCIGLAHSGEPPTIVLDAGTGLQQLSRVLRGRAFRGTLLLSHLHWDHTHGMPFFRSGTLAGSRVDVYLPEQGVEPEELLERAISPPHFPIRPKQLGDGWTFNAIEPGHHEFEGFSVAAL